MRNENQIRAAAIKLVCSDFDGVMTDGTVYTDVNGVESVRCSRRDGLGVDLLKRAGIGVYVISKETSVVVAKRCAKLKVPCEHAVRTGEGKADIVRRLAVRAGLELREVAYIGDDVNDLPALRIVGFAATVADCHPRVAEIAHFVTEARGGEHAFREFCEFILTAQGHPIEF